MTEYNNDLFSSYEKSLEGEKKNLRIIVLLLGLVITFLIYTIKLFTLQVIEGKVYRQRSRTISSQVKTIPANRGEIFDRNASLPLVINTDSFAIDLTPAEIPAGYYDTVASKLAKYLDIPKNYIDKKVPQRLRSSYKTIEIRVNVPFSVISNIAENITDLPGVSWRSKPMRNYVETGSISHVIGYVGDITKEEFNVMYNHGYKANSIIGKTGIEKQYDSYLQGTSGLESRTVDARGHIISDEPVITPPESGKNLVLTIDSNIQKLAEQALGKRVGAAVVLKPSNGEVLAMVSYPFYDQNLFNSDDASAAYTKLATSPNNPLLNRAVNAVYPPASTFKTIMTTAILAEKAVPAEKKIECAGRIVYGNRTFTCHIKYPGHGYLDLKNALAQSCDVYFWVVGRDNLGVDKIASYSKEFGFGESLGIDLPAQSTGFVPTSQWKERRYHETWKDGDTMNMSIGQGYTLVTPMHVANMMAMVCNEGKIYKPHLLKEVRDPSTNEAIEIIKPEILKKSSIDRAVWKEVQQDLRYTITDGTAQYPMNNKRFQLAGKTGTAEVNGALKNHWHSWMVAYGPYDAPVEEQYVVSVIVEAVNDWEWWAPYCTNIIFQGILANQTFDEAIDTLGFRYLVKTKKRQE
ncbi:penicillin-binding protein 2 [uncultured Treponema sp.]|uniref:penicillin-binding protein 2 n=1 Tax=uncultured Treponema sp. TaxID=162155 RepID=UPI0015B99F35|nr:penicillin-binding protein 2 [uncultured Treponema sp.]